VALLRSDLKEEVHCGDDYIFLGQSDTSAVSELRAVERGAVIAAAKTGRRAPFGELCERHMKQVSCVTRRIIRTVKTRKTQRRVLSECFRPSQGILMEDPICNLADSIAINGALMKLRKNAECESSIDEPKPVV